MAESIIAWTDFTANFWMGCQKVSAGCANCYAETLTKNRMGIKVWGPPATTARQPVKGIWAHVRKWNKDAQAAKKHARVFLGSLMDWAEDHPSLDAIRAPMWEAIKASPWLHFQMLTKRPERIEQLLPKDWGPGGWQNVWLGTSIEDIRVAERADHLRKIPAVVRFISYEPAIGSLNELDITGIDWVIYGGESGPGHRPEDKEWAREMHRKCAAEKIAFFHKQSSGFRTEMGIELDGKIVREYPVPREIPRRSPRTLFA